MIVLGEGTTRIPVGSLWFLLIYASDLLAQLRISERQALLAGKRDNDLIDAIAELLVTEVEHRLRRQLSVQYRPRRADLTRVRDRIDHLRTMTRAYPTKAESPAASMNSPSTHPATVSSPTPCCPPHP
jgi:5-methylcytosine-specific restriction enzyme subunit McrC